MDRASEAACARSWAVQARQRDAAVLGSTGGWCPTRTCNEVRVEPPREQAAMGTAVRLEKAPGATRRSSRR